MGSPQAPYFPPSDSLQNSNHAWLILSTYQYCSNPWCAGSTQRTTKLFHDRMPCDSFPLPVSSTSYQSNVRMPKRNIQFLAVITLLTFAHSISSEKAKRIALATSARLEDCARCAQTHKQYALCADFIARKSAYVLSGPHSVEDDTSTTLRRELENKLLLAKDAGLSGQQNSDYCQGIVSTFYDTDGPLYAECSGVCNCESGKVVRARGKTARAALAEGASRCAVSDPNNASCAPGCSCKLCQDYKSYCIPKGNGFEAVVNCAAGAFGGEKTAPCS